MTWCRIYVVYIYDSVQNSNLRIVFLDWLGTSSKKKSPRRPFLDGGRSVVTMSSLATTLFHARKFDWLDWLSYNYIFRLLPTIRLHYQRSKQGIMMRRECCWLLADSPRPAIDPHHPPNYNWSIIRKLIVSSVSKVFILYNRVSTA